MRVGLVCPYSLTLPGGVQTQVLGLARVLRRRGVDARVLGPCDGPPPEAGVTPLGNSLHTHANGSMASIAPDVPASLRTIRALRDEDFDVVHLHEPLVPGPSLTALMFCQSPMVGTFHRSGDSFWYGKIAWSNRWAIDRLGIGVAVSDAAAATARYAGAVVEEVLWNGIDVEEFRQVEPWPRQGPTVLFVGRHEERKGLAVLLDAMRRVGSASRGPLQGRRAQLWVAGDGPQTAALRAATGSDPGVEWLGAIGEVEKLRRLRAADVFCAPSLHGESFGVVLLEALTAGAAVVASDLDGYRNVVRDGVDGLLTAPGDPDALASALRQALDAGGRSGPLAAAGQRRAEEFGMDRLADRYLALYDRAIAGQGRRRHPGGGRWTQRRWRHPLR